MGEGIEIPRLGCFKGVGDICEKDGCKHAQVCIWRRKPEEGGRGPLVSDLTPGAGKMEGGKPILRR